MNLQNCTDAGLFILDADGYFLAAPNIIELGWEDILGRRFEDVLPEWGAGWFPESFDLACSGMATANLLRRSGVTIVFSGYQFGSHVHFSVRCFSSLSASGVSREKVLGS